MTKIRINELNIISNIVIAYFYLPFIIIYKLYRFAKDVFIIKFNFYGLTIILSPFLVGCTKIGSSVRCTDPDMYCDNNSVLASFKEFNGKSIGLFKINNIDDTLYYDSNKEYSDITLFVVNCTLIKDYYGNDIKVSNNVNFAFYLNSSCENYYNFKSVKKYLNRLNKFVSIYYYSKIEDLRNLTYKTSFLKKRKNN